MSPGGSWRLAPAYDLTFSVDLSAPDYVNRQSLSVGGKTDRITVRDLEELGKRQDINGAGEIIGQVTDALNHFPQFAREMEIPEKYIQRIQSATDLVATRPTVIIKPKKRGQGI